jgi:hypothetical protein
MPWARQDLTGKGSWSTAPCDKRASELLAESREEQMWRDIYEQEDDHETESNIEWECCENNLKDREFLKEVLPQEYHCKITKLKIIDSNSIKEEVKFATEFKVDICQKEEVEEFVKIVESKTGTAYLPDTNRIRSNKWVSKRYHCHRNVRDQRSSEVGKGGKGSGSGRVMGQERQEGKGTKCEADLSYRLYPCEEGCKGKCYKLTIKIHYNHNHEISSTDSFNFLTVNEDTKSRYIELFEEAYTPHKARVAFIKELKEKLGDLEYFKISANRSINPDSSYVFNLYSKYSKRFGSANGPDSYLKAVEQVKKINDKAGEKVASIRQLTCGTVVVAVCDEVMKRTLTLVPQSGDIMYVDGSLDRCNHQVVKFLTESPAGGLPVGLLVLINHTENTLDAGIEDLKALMPEGAFYGRGRDRGPKVIITDDDTAEISSMKTAWPQATCLLCQWHVLQVMCGINYVGVKVT